MIYALFGLPGSGKSYLAIKEFVVDRMETDTIISNIALSPNIEYPEQYKYIDKFELNTINTKIKHIMLDVSKSHDEKKHQLQSVFDEYGKGDITLIVDECHLYGYRGRSSSDSWADDFLSIHRHALGAERKFDIVLITQVPSRLNTEIASQVEVAIKALPSSQRVLSSFLEYKYFGSVDALKKNDKTMLLKSKMIKGEQKVFELYQSGFSNQGDNGFRKKMIFIVIGLLLVTAYVINGFYGLISNDKQINTKEVNNVASNSNASNAIDTDSNTTLQKNHQIICTHSPYKLQDVTKIKDYAFSFKNNDMFTYCYKVYES